MEINKNGEIREIIDILRNIKSSAEMSDFISEIFTVPELETLSKRWRILKMLLEGRTQRDIAQELKVSLCKITRGSKILKDKKSVVHKYLKK